MQKIQYLAAVFVAAFLSACSSGTGVPSADMDKITLSFLNAKIYAGGAVSCKDGQLAERLYVGCQNRSLDGGSSVSLWLYEDGIFKSVNGTARGFAEGPLAGQSHIATMPLPLPADIDIAAAMAAVK